MMQRSLLTGSEEEAVVAVVEAVLRVRHFHCLRGPWEAVAVAAGVVHVLLRQSWLARAQGVAGVVVAEGCS